jgi:uncharacterized membrane protein
VPIRKKIILVSIFSATVAIMISAVVRVALVNSTRQSADIAWLYFWGNVEVGVGNFHTYTEVQVHRLTHFPAIIVSRVASFYQLFVAKHGQT